MTECVYNISAAAVVACSSVRRDSHHTVAMKPSSGCVQAGSYISGGALLFTSLYGLGLATTLVLKEVALPGIYNLPQFYICSPALATYSETGQPDDGCISSSAIWRQLDLALSNEVPRWQRCSQQTCHQSQCRLARRTPPHRLHLCSPARPHRPASRPC